MKSDCTKRLLVYQTWCETCYKEDIKKIDEEETDEEEKELKKKAIRVYKYVGESKEA